MGFISVIMSAYAPKTYLFLVLMSLCQFFATHKISHMPMWFYVFICADRRNGRLLPTVWRLYTEAWRYHHHSTGSSLCYIPRRAVLYCPGNDERKLKKLALLDVDCAVLDCEDGVALTKKVQNCTYFYTKTPLSILWTEKEHMNRHSFVTQADSNFISLHQTGVWS